MQSEEEKEDLRAFNKDASFHSGYFELWRVLWIFVMFILGARALGMVAESVRAWWHFQEHEREPLNVGLTFGGFIFAYFAYSLCADEERKATDRESLSFERERFLEKRRKARENGDKGALGEKPFQRYGCLKILGGLAVVAALASLYAVRQP